MKGSEKLREKSEEDERNRRGLGAVQKRVRECSEEVEKKVKKEV